MAVVVDGSALIWNIILSVQDAIHKICATLPSSSCSLKNVLSKIVISALIDIKDYGVVSSTMNWRSTASEVSPLAYFHSISEWSSEEVVERLELNDSLLAYPDSCQFIQVVTNVRVLIAKGVVPIPTHVLNQWDKNRCVKILPVHLKRLTTSLLVKFLK